MFRGLFVSIGTTALASATLMLGPGTALGQHGGRGGEHHGGAAQAGTWHGDVRSYGGWAGYRSGYYGHRRDWDRGSRWGYPGWGWSSAYYGWGWGSPYYSLGTGLYGAYYPYYSSSLDTQPYYSMYAPLYEYGYSPNYDMGSSVTTAPDTAAHIVVYTPDPDADVWFEGQPTSERGTVCEFELPALAPIRDYIYEIRARWTEGGKIVERTQRIHVQAGHEVTVNFTRSQPAAETSKRSSN
jgi:uncharacterized protein (TIGR03000 family)